MTDRKEITPEQAQEVIDKHEDAINPNGLASEVDPSSGIVMKAQPFDKSVLTYDPEDVEYDEEARKAAERSRKEADKAK